MSNTLNSAVTPSTLCGQQPPIRFEIPIYQRLFAWEEAQIMQLFEDIAEAYKKPDSRYYIGIITIVDRGDENREENNQHINAQRWEIVDGQQRLVFLILCGIEALRSNDIDYEIKSQWRDFVYLPSDNSPDNAILRVHFFGRQEDNADLLQLAKGQNDSTIQNQAFLRFQEYFDRFRAKHNGDFSTQKFFEFIVNKVSFLVSELDNYLGSELNIFFERMNSTGRQLEPEEMIKGLYFAKHSEKWNQLLNFSSGSDDCAEGNPANPDTTFLTILNNPQNASIPAEPLQENTGDNDIIRPIVSVPALLLHVLKLTVAGEKNIDLNPRHLLTTFKQNFQPDKMIEPFLENMEKYRGWMEGNIIFHTASGLDFRNEDTRVDTDDSQERRRKLRQFQSMLTVSSDDRQFWLLKAYQKMGQPSQGPLDLKLLKEVDAEMHPISELFKENEQKISSAKLQYGVINRYWFWKLDYLLWELHEEDRNNDRFKDLSEEEHLAISSYQFKSNRSIEHLHPQTSDKPWDETILPLRDETILPLHSFGNLCMISVRSNSIQSNASVGVKFAWIRDDQLSKGNLESIKGLLMFKKCEGKEVNWTPKKAEEHEGEMLAVLKVIKQPD